MFHPLSIEGVGGERGEAAGEKWGLHFGNTELGIQAEDTGLRGLVVGDHVGDRRCQDRAQANIHSQGLSGRRESKEEIGEEVWAKQKSPRECGTILLVVWEMVRLIKTGSRKNVWERG